MAALGEAVGEDGADVAMIVSEAFRRGKDLRYLGV